MVSTALKAFLADSVSTLLINSSFSIQKMGHRQVEHLKDSRRAHTKSGTWWWGFIMMMIGVAVHIIAVPYADLTLLAANSPLAIFANLFLSIWLFGEKWVWKYDFTALIFILTGCTVIVLLSNKSQ